MAGGTSYLGANDTQILIGLGRASQADRVEVRWPSGRTQSWTGLPAEQDLLIEEGHEPRLRPIAAPRTPSGASGTGQSRADGPKLLEPSSVSRSGRPTLCPLVPRRDSDPVVMELELGCDPAKRHVAAHAVFDRRDRTERLRRPRGLVT